MAGIKVGREEGEGRPALLVGMVASRVNSGSEHDTHGICYRRGAAVETTSRSNCYHMGGGK